MISTEPQISWMLTASPTSDASFATSPIDISGSTGAALASRIVGQELFLSNTGGVAAVNAGIFITPGLPDGSPDMETFEEVIKWSGIEDPGGIPYGLFTVFGYNALNVSYIDSFLANTLTATEARLFIHDWNQGLNAITPINLNVAARSMDGSLVTSSSLETTVDGTSANIYGETTGVVKILIGVRIPSGVTPLNSIPMTHNLYYEN